MGNLMIDSVAVFFCFSYNIPWKKIIYGGNGLFQLKLSEETIKYYYMTVVEKYLRLMLVPGGDALLLQ